MIYRFINAAVDMIFPRRCPVCHDIVDEKGALICGKCIGRFEYVKEPFCMKCGKPVIDDGKEYCTECEGNVRKYDEGRAVFIYDDAMRLSIYSFKYNDRQEYAKYYAKEIEAKLGKKIKSWDADVLIPIPLHKSKQISRGYNQAYLIAKELSNLIKIPVENDVLIRDRKTTVQKNLNAKDRVNNVKNAFKIKQNNVKFKSAILIDDIYTTGATVSSAAEALKACGVKKVYFISLSIGRR